MTRTGPSRDGEETLSYQGALGPGETVCAPGQRIGRYVVVSGLGRGGCGAVYLARDEELDRLVAVKVPARDCLQSDADLGRFVDDARTACKLNHPGIVAVYDVGRQADGTPFIVMEYVEGGSLKQSLASGPWPAARAAKLVAAVAEAVHHAHRKGFVHRDLKPSNILLDAEGKPRVVDFGLAMHESQRWLQAGTSPGTPCYMAPEQVRGQTQFLDGRTDIWALGVTLYEMLTGALPFRGENVAQLADDILNRLARPLRQTSDGIPEELERICLKCLAKGVGDRYATATDLARDLRRLVQPRRRRWLVAVAAGAAARALLVALLIVPALRRPSDQPAPSTPLPLSGTIDVLVWGPAHSPRRGLRLTDPGALPLVPGDRIRLEARLNRPAYLYLIAIDSEARALPVYPWQSGQWSERLDESPQQHLSLPPLEDHGFEVKPPFGTETFVLLARESPLPEDVNPGQVLAGLPHQEGPDVRLALWFDDGNLVTKQADLLRGFDLAQSRPIDDSLLRLHRVVRERLDQHFALIRAVTFVSQPERR